MPELPEVETICQGLRPHVTGRTIIRVVVRREDLRHPVDGRTLQQEVVGRCLTGLDRRGKYLLGYLDRGGLVIHLGMSGVLRWLPDDRQPPDRHDHIDLVLADGGMVRFHDPRRFGAFLWHPASPADHPVLALLGPEPLSEACSAAYLAGRAAGRGVTLREFLMDGRVVAGIGNIYAAEICFQARLHPLQPVGQIPATDWQRVLRAMRQVLRQAIRMGGTTLRDFRNSEGRPGYFQQALQVYGKAGTPCGCCGGEVQRLKLGGRSAYLCPSCQSVIGSVAPTT